MVAYGASGRNAGMLAETLDHTHGLAIQHFGKAEAARLAALGEQNVEELAGFLRDKDIRCDYEPSGRLMVSFTEGHLEEARRNLEVARSLAFSPTACSRRRRCRPRCIPPCTRAAWR